MEWWGWVAAALGAIVLISNGINAIKNIFSPVLKMGARLDLIEEHDKKDLSRFEAIDKKFQSQEATNQAVMQALLAIINHEIDGNGIDGMKKARDELLKHIISAS